MNCDILNLDLLVGPVASICKCLAGQQGCRQLHRQRMWLAREDGVIYLLATSLSCPGHPFHQSYVQKWYTCLHGAIRLRKFSRQRTHCMHLEDLPLSDGCALKVMKNWLHANIAESAKPAPLSFRTDSLEGSEAHEYLPFVLGLLLAMLTIPRLLCLSDSLISSANLPFAVLKMLFPPRPVPA